MAMEQTKMETATKYTNKPLETLYPLEWEERAYQEVLQGFKAMWRNKRDRFLALSRENENIALEEKNLPNLQSGNKELVDLYETIFHQLIFQEPYLYRMLAYITMNPEDREARQAFFERYLEPVNFAAYQDILDIDVMQNSDFAKSLNLSGIPLHTCFVGKVLKNLFDKTDNRWMTDNGKPELVRFEKIQNGLIIEYLNEADYKSPLADEIIDNILYGMSRKAQGDRRQNLFLGNGLDHREYKIVKRFGNEEKKSHFICCQNTLVLLGRKQRKIKQTILIRNPSNSKRIRLLGFF